MTAHRPIPSSALVEQLADAAREQLRVDVTRAMALAESAIAIAEQIHDDEALGRALRAKGNVLWAKGQYKPAVRLFERAVTLFQRARKVSEVGRTLSTSIQPLALMGEYRRALSVAKKAGAIFKRTGEKWRLARLEINIANVFHRRGHAAKALSRYQNAYAQLLPHRDHEGVGVALHNMAVCLINLNDFRKARETYQNARKFYRKHAMPLLAAQADYNIAYLHYLCGDYSRALHLLKEARETCDLNGDRYHSALCSLDQSEIYLDLNLLGEGEDLARSAAAQFEQLGLAFEAMKALTNVAIALDRQHDTTRALKLFNDARRKAVAEEHAIWPRIIDLYRAAVLLQQGHLAGSRRLARTALAFFLSVPLPAKAAICHILLARVCLQSRDVKGADGHCREALSLIELLGMPMLAYQANLLVGQVREAESDTEAASRSYEIARLSLESLRSSLRADELRITFMKDRHEVYERLIHLCLNRSNNGGVAVAEEAFRYMEEAKSRSLRDLLLTKVRVLPSPKSQAGAIKRQVHRLREELNWYYGRIEKELWSQQIRTDEIQNLEAEARARERTLQRILREHDWETIDRKLRISTVLTTEKIRASLTEETVLVEYFSVCDRIVAVVMTSDNLEIVRLGPVSRLRDLLRSLQFQFSRVRLHTKRGEDCHKTLIETTEVHLRALYDEVFGPLRPRLHARDHVIFVPHDILHCLPFHALSDGSHYLADSFTISYAPSASIYSLCHNRRANSSGPCLILGVPDTKIPNVVREVQSVSSAIPGSKVFIGPEATLDVLRKSGAESRMIHIATHGSFRQDNPLFSNIRLGDSYLNFYDLYQLRLPVQLLTLSGCSTGLNAVAAGDELLGLIRGLIYAGAQSLVLSLWDVNDRSTARLMELFYRRVTTVGKAKALRTAMLELRREFPHPYYWAPFVLVGKAS